LRKRFQLHVADTERDHFLHSGAGSEHGGEQHVVAASIGSGAMHARQHRLHLIVFQVVNGAGTGALERNGQHPLAMLDPCGINRRTVPEKSVNGCQSNISGCDEIMSSSLQMLQECQHLCGIEITQIQLAHGSFPSRGDKTEKEHEGISIAEDGVRAAPAHAG
jgi:hypothetical protein